MNALLDALPLGAALLPLGLYLLGLGWIHLRCRPLAINGVWDGVLLGLSLIGLVTVGPLALVQPAVGGSSWTWPMLLSVFCLVVTLCVLVSRPRLVVYNISPEQIRPLVAEVVAALDPQARWAGETVALPTRGFQIHIDGDGALRTVSLVAVGLRSAHEGWGEMSRRMRRAVRGLRVRSSPWGAVFAALGSVLIALSAWSIAASVLSPKIVSPAPAVGPESPPVHPSPLPGVSDDSPPRSVAA
ncbi:MAG: hypothetical protein DWH79_04245 [Planctomycetota bacterium]|nr:MAG: hypothetical protein DWH79_04245 [Planctomycetota bacterium]